MASRLTGSGGAGDGDDEIDRWRDWLVDQGVSIEREIRWPGGAYSLYFRDPAGNELAVWSDKAPA